MEKLGIKLKVGQIVEGLNGEEIRVTEGDCLTEGGGFSDNDYLDADYYLCIGFEGEVLSMPKIPMAVWHLIDSQKNSENVKFNFISYGNKNFSNIVISDSIKSGYDWLSFLRKLNIGILDKQASDSSYSIVLSLDKKGKSIVRFDNDIASVL